MYEDGLNQAISHSVRIPYKRAWALPAQGHFIFKGYPSRCVGLQAAGEHTWRYPTAWMIGKDEEGCEGGRREAKE